MEPKPNNQRLLAWITFGLVQVERLLTVTQSLPAVNLTVAFAAVSVPQAARTQPLKTHLSMDDVYPKTKWQTLQYLGTGLRYAFLRDLMVRDVTIGHPDETGMAVMNFHCDASHDFSLRHIAPSRRSDGAITLIQTANPYDWFDICRWRTKLLDTKPSVADSCLDHYDTRRVGGLSSATRRSLGLHRRGVELVSVVPDDLQLFLDKHPQPN